MEISRGFNNMKNSNKISNGASNNNYQALLNELLDVTVREQASDLHISVDHPPVLRIAGRLIPLLKKKNISSKDALGLSQVLMKIGRAHV